MSGRAVAMRVLRRGAARGVTVGADREHDEPAADHGIDRREGQDGKSDAGARLGGAVDVAPVQQAADQPLPPWLRGPDGVRRQIGHR